MSRQQRFTGRNSPEEIERLMRAARVQRAQLVRRALRALFRRRAKDDAWPHAKARALGFNPCR